ncbi:hypothetical protein HY024_03650 [Candidatus Curtissbacteria bacterium]|nr:hypothetical protein [Candidatus Curtissbacteria bacterium]
MLDWKSARLPSKKLGFLISMTATAHALIGAAIASKIPNPYISIPLAIISHIALDLVPHWDASTNRRSKSIMRLRLEATFDVLLGFSLAYLLFWNRADPAYTFAVIVAAQLPDWLQAPHVMYGNKFPLFYWAYWVSHNTQTKMQLPWGLVTQIVTVGVVVGYALATTMAR